MELKLRAQIRQKDEKLSVEFLPAVLYGKGLTTQSLKIKRADFDKLFRTAGESNLISLELGAQKTQVLVKDFQRDVIKDFIIHVDFYQVNMKEKITAEIPFNFVGESKAVRELGGMLMKELEAVEVECLPDDLLDHLDIDISGLDAFDDTIRLSDINLPSTMKLMADTSNVVVTIKEPRVEEETPVETEAELSEAEDEVKTEESATGKKEEVKPGEAEKVKPETEKKD